MATTHFGINAETMMCGHTIVEGGSDLWATDGTLVSCFECFEVHGESRSLCDEESANA